MEAKEWRIKIGGNGIYENRPYSQQDAMSINLTKETDSPIEEEQGWRIFLTLSAILISGLAVTFNFILILVVLLTKSLRTPTNTFIVSLAVAEILLGLFHVPFVASSMSANGWPFSKLTCRCSAFLQVHGRTVATFSLLAISIDRCVAVSRPLAYSHIITFKFVIAFLSTVWSLALIMAILPLTSFGSYRYSSTFYACILYRTTGNYQHLIKELVCTIFPCFCIFTCLIIIVKEVKYHHRIFAMFPVPSPQEVFAVTNPTVAAAAAGVDGGGVGNECVGSVAGSSSGHRSMSAKTVTTSSGVLPGIRSFNRNTMKALRPLFVMCIFYGLFCIPASVLYLVAQRTDYSGSQDAQLVIVWMSFFSSVLNPIVVILFNRKFRETVREFITH